MANINREINMNINPDVAIKKMEKATIAAEKLKKTLDELKHIEIGFEVIETKKKWWQFWR